MKTGGVHIERTTEKKFGLQDLASDNESIDLDEPEIISISFGNWTLDVYQREIIDNENVAVALSAAEYRLLQVFLQLIVGF